MSENQESENQELIDWMFWEVKPLLPSICCLIRMKRVLYDGVTGWSIESSELEPLLKHFQVETLEELQGKHFESPKRGAISALDFFLVQLKHNGNYKPPSKQKLIIRAARALANMEEPDFSDVDSDTVCSAFLEPWNFFNLDEKWMRMFTGMVDPISFVS